ncbi:ABC transporter ATP-binding protein [Spiroplasma endosymbiont of Amphimallon solstitiale]|uniref:ABC transporter ATP-binding protein n=1 Tax=Spiroplasma endosymbiont of Amphimallon solstitiale TaxID=3066288 RepID=UPI00313EAEB6
MENNEQNKKKIDKSRPLVEILNLTKEYRNKVALNKVNLTINPGDRIGIIGANGNGKSTLSEIIGGIRKPTSGEIIRQEHLVNGLQFQESRYPAGISVMDMIKYYLHTFNISMKEDELLELLKTYQLLGIENKFIQTLSGGQQQRLNILLAVIHDPDLVILDEVSTGLDIEVRSEIFEFFRKNIIDKNKTMILVTHNMSEVEEFCFNYVEKYGWPKIIHQFTLKILFLIKNLLKVTLFSLKIL